MLEPARKAWRGAASVANYGSLGEVISASGNSRLISSEGRLSPRLRMCVLEFPDVPRGKFSAPQIFHTSSKGREAAAVITARFSSIINVAHTLKACLGACAVISDRRFQAVCRCDLALFAS
jgi:hypothetical protein